MNWSPGSYILKAKARLFCSKSATDKGMVKKNTNAGMAYKERCIIFTPEDPNMKYPFGLTKNLNVYKAST